MEFPSKEGVNNGVSVPVLTQGVKALRKQPFPKVFQVCPLLEWWRNLADEIRGDQNQAELLIHKPLFQSLVLGITQLFRNRSALPECRGWCFARGKRGLACWPSWRHQFVCYLWKGVISSKLSVYLEIVLKNPEQRETFHSQNKKLKTLISLLPVNGSSECHLCRAYQ